MDASSRRPDRGLLLISNLPALQNLIKRDPDGYAAEFATQWDHYQSLRSVILLGLSVAGGGDLIGAGSTTQTGASGNNKGRRETEDKFREVIGFLAQTAPCFATKQNPIRSVKSLPSELSSLLLERHDRLHPDTRKALVQALVGIRRKDPSNCMLTNLELLHVLFGLLPLTTSPTLRASILKTILTDIKMANKKAKNQKLNRSIQGLLFSMVENGINLPSGIGGSALEGTGLKKTKNKSQNPEAKTSGREAMWAVKLASELWRKGIWNDSKTIRILADACFHFNTKVQSAAIHFFLADPESSAACADDQDSDNDQPQEINVRQVKHVQTINKKRKSTEKKTEKKIKAAAKLQRAKEAGASRVDSNFSALHLLQDPQHLAEQLYEALMRNDKVYTLEHKVLILRLFSRICSAHKLQVLPFYSYVLKYIVHHQLEVTSILASLAESVHELTPPDVLTPCLRKLANEFVHPGVASTVIAAGLNSIAQICRRQPLAMEPDLLADLIEYRKSKDKGVIAASRGLLGLFREVNPTILKSRDLGKKAAMEKQKARSDAPPSELVPGLGHKVARYGEIRGQVSSIAGLDLLENAISSENRDRQDGDEEEGDELEGWEVASSDGDDSDSDRSGGWIDVSSDGASDLDVSDSSDEDTDDETESPRSKKRRKTAKANTKRNSKSTGSDDEDNDAGSDEDDDTCSQATTNAPKPLSESLAATKILTPADFARLNELKISAIEEAAKAAGSKNANSVHQKLLKELRKRAYHDPQGLTTFDGDLAGAGGQQAHVTEGDIIGKQKKAKQDYEERMASIQAGRQGREKFGSSKVRGRKGLKNGATGSSTNEAKSRQKAFAMTQNSNKVRSKKGASLRDRQKVLRAHIDRKKRGGRRGNN
ncbi:Severe Depolymerization of Actin [Puccinia graminis f. sp. tritici]|uniref:Protein SDA1 n=1 Tax=Puccinia graminis f. sp. tritici TaxID=56615 RepID=A0A5B0N517_PUCGR|nr:Severe Depolymerization of Actin [Puccinia graminis f. sp. tritici]KAA1093943.1 Severe Depolymerization of Actin [Puccinia graminis f. sp. tritici]